MSQNRSAKCVSLTQRENYGVAKFNLRGTDTVPFQEFLLPMSKETMNLIKPGRYYEISLEEVVNPRETDKLD